MLDANVHPLFNVTVPDHFVHDHTDGMWGYIIDDTRSSMVELVRHTLLLGSVRLNIDDIADPVVDKERREFDRAVLCMRKSIIVSKSITTSFSTYP